MSTVLAMKAGMIQATLQAAVGMHAFLTLASIGYPLLSESSSAAKKKKSEEAFDAKHYQLMTDFVADMYGGRGISHNARGVYLDESVTFEDSAAICSSRNEVQEAFRALQYIQPRSLSPPKCIDVIPKGDSIELMYALNQQYAGRFNLFSLLVVNVQLGQIYGTPESEFVVTKFEERWNDIEPFGSYLFRAVRRINGVISWNVTTRLMPADSEAK